MRRLFLLVVTASVAVTSARAQDSTASTTKSVWKGVYTEEQATRGDAEHQNSCLACHGTEKYAGEPFVKNWVGRTLFDLYDQLKTTMPDDNPGGLSAQQYKAVVAYILKVNGIPAGTDSLPDDPEALRLIKIDPKPDKQTALGARVPSAVFLGVLEARSHRSGHLRPLYHPHTSILPTATR